jgi:hypothetical protein
MRPPEDPHIWTVVLKPVAEAVREGRDLVATAFGSWGMDTYEPRVVAGELLANAWHASAEGQHIVVRAYLNGDRPTLEVWDESPRLPVVGEPSPTDEHGRGLLIVAEYTARWGVRPCPEGGKVIWAEFPN